MQKPALPAGMSAFTTPERFCIPYRGSILSFDPGKRHVVEPEVRRLIETTDLRVKWENRRVARND